MPGPIIGIFFLFFIFAVVMMIAGTQQAKKRKLALSQWAQRNNLRFSPERNRDFDNRYPFRALKQGRRRYAYNISRGTWNRRDLKAFDYHYAKSTSDGKGGSKTKHYYFSAILLTSELRLKPLAIRPEHLFDKIAGGFGFDDIDFESAAFSRLFHVSAEDKRWAYDVIHPQTIEFLMQHPGYSIEFENNEVLVNFGGRTFDPPDFEKAITIAEGLLDRLPGYLKKD